MLEQVRQLMEQDVVDDPLRHALKTVGEPDGGILHRAGSRESPPGLDHLSEFEGSADLLPMGERRIDGPFVKLNASEGASHGGFELGQ